MPEYMGVDLSKWQSDVDYRALKDGRILGGRVKFAMLRMGFGRRLDDSFLRHLEGCRSVGIYVGAYIYSTALTVSGAHAEASFVIDTIRKHGLDGKIDYPIALDVEETDQLALPKEQLTDICLAFMDDIAAENYQPMLYMSAAAYNDNVERSRLERYPLWVAAYVSEQTLRDKYRVTEPAMWQFGIAGNPSLDIQGVGEVAGVRGECDCDRSYVGFAAKIRDEGLNRFPERYLVTGRKYVREKELQRTKRELERLGFDVTAEAE